MVPFKLSFALFTQEDGVPSASQEHCAHQSAP